MPPAARAVSDAERPEIGDKEGARVCGQQTSRGINAGPRIGSVPTGCVYPRMCESRDVRPISDGIRPPTTRRASLLAKPGSFAALCVGVFPHMTAKQGAQRGQSEACPRLLPRNCRSSATSAPRTSRSTRWRRSDGEKEGPRPAMRGFRACPGRRGANAGMADVADTPTAQLREVDRAGQDACVVTEAGLNGYQHDFHRADLANMAATTNGTQGPLLWWPSLGAQPSSSAVYRCAPSTRCRSKLASRPPRGRARWSWIGAAVTSAPAERVPSAPPAVVGSLPRERPLGAGAGRPMTPNRVEARPPLSIPRSPFVERMNGASGASESKEITMGRIVVHEFTTLDGVIDNPAWSMEYGMTRRWAVRSAGSCNRARRC